MTVEKSRRDVFRMPAAMTITGRSSVQRLEVYERWKPRDPLAFPKVMPAEVWSGHWANWKAVLEALKRSQ